MFILFNLITLNRESTLWLTKKKYKIYNHRYCRFNRNILLVGAKKKSENCKLVTSIISVKNVQES